MVTFFQTDAPRDSPLYGLQTSLGVRNKQLYFARLDWSTGLYIALLSGRRHDHLWWAPHSRPWGIPLRPARPQTDSTVARSLRSLRRTRRDGNASMSLRHASIESLLPAEDKQDEEYLFLGLRP